MSFVKTFMSIFSSSQRRCIKAVTILTLNIFYLISVGAINNCRAQGFVTAHNRKSYTVYRVDLEHQQLELWSKDNTGTRFRNAGAIKVLAETHGKRLIFATNAGIFDRLFVPLGLHVENGRQLRPLNVNSGQGNFYMKPNGVFFIAGRRGFVVSTEVFDPKIKVDFASQSGPLLLSQGSINQSFDPNSKNWLVRSGVGIRERSQAIFAISNEPVSFYEFAELFKNGLKCESALYLDGVISVMYAADLGRQQASGDFAAMFVLFNDIHGK
jgi:uncharacterized protein YigE (DUF2233 family)